MENLAKIPLLPPEIMVEIFLLLPLESILTCKLVSKEWNDLIKRPIFIKLYNIESRTFFLRDNKLNCLFRDDDCNSYKVHVLPLKLENRYRQFVYQHEVYELLMESSNKIACVEGSNGHFYLHNLITGDSNVVTDAPFKYTRVCYGFGYDRYEDDYKIIVVCLCDNANYYDANGSRIFVYSYRNRGWKSLEGFPHASYTFADVGGRAAYSFNGVLYWVVDKRGTYGGTRVIVALDVHSYGLAEIELLLPVYYKIWNAKVTELDGDLCCLLQRSELEVWVMKEESWTKLFSIETWLIRFPFHLRNYTVGLYKCGDVGKIGVSLCHNSKLELFRYDVDKDKIQVFKNAPKIENSPKAENFPKIENKFQVLAEFDV